MRNTDIGRHRAAGRPSTPLTELAASIVAGKMPRRVASVATAGGLMISAFGAAASQAAPAEIEDTTTLELAAIAAQAQAALAAAPVVAIPANLELEIEGLDLDNEVEAVEVTPAPEPEPEPEPAAFAATSSFGALVANIAARYQGVPYVWGGTTPAGFDCSGFTQYVFSQAGVNLPRTSSAQRGAGTVVSQAAARPGDLVWWSGHVAIYLGNGMIIDSPSPGGVVSIRPMFRSGPTFIRLG